MTDTVTSQNTDLSSWDTLYNLTLCFLCFFLYTISFCFLIFLINFATCRVTLSFLSAESQEMLSHTHSRHRSTAAAQAFRHDRKVQTRGLRRNFSKGDSHKICFTSRLSHLRIHLQFLEELLFPV